MDHDDQDERSEQVRGALVKGLVALLAVAVLIALGTTLMVRTLGLDEGGSEGAVGSTTEPSDPLPSSALPVPGEESPTAQPSESPSESAGGDIALSVSPASVGPMQRINLTGTYRGGDNARLEVQRQEDGAWTNFGVDAGVTAGTFQTYVMSGRTGENLFRLYDPANRKASNVVEVTIG
ncbi:hypothetical protein ASG49_09335 [Marmoricola sp. Leaf446]|uniref:hypothetical protein n=1 Tax=Marmoricola sp. Leaf446 TaxID=1736379 RepID=UPI0006F22425|nr:hypothetical protein [Marmoricola sp. Leaf446]KQT92150.1 hypothetical protein ASG49_09335 [Marmoricola sp. Leaf446]